MMPDGQANGQLELCAAIDAALVLADREGMTAAAAHLAQARELAHCYDNTRTNQIHE